MLSSGSPYDIGFAIGSTFKDGFQKFIHDYVVSFIDLFKILDYDIICKKLMQLLLLRHLFSKAYLTNLETCRPSMSF